MQEGQSPSVFTTTVSADGLRATITVTGEVDILHSSDLAGEICLQLEMGRPTTVDMSGVSFLDAAGVSALVRARLSSVESGTELRIVNATHRAVTRVLSVTGVDQFLPLDPPVSQN
jgi:anti-anti-sigma factor